ncbi:MAG TPA: ABC transporter ATP-binding protein, partial [Chloroflexota bacterium]|nr:ABC transporter ATP-binding protein [Chloroflexota bacterium]
FCSLPFIVSRASAHMVLRPDTYTMLARGALSRIREALGVLAGTPRVLKLVWAAHAGYATALVATNALQGLAPAAGAWLNKLLMDAVAAALFGPNSGQLGSLSPLGASDPWSAAPAIFGLFILWFAFTIVRRSLNPLQDLVRQHLGDYLTRDLNLLILDKANSLRDITFFESPRFHDLLQKARNEVQWRPFATVSTVLFMLQQLIVLTTMLGFVLAFSPGLALLIVVCTVPSLVQQFRHRRQMYAINNWSVPDVRRMNYYRQLLIDKADAKETRVFGLGDYFLRLYHQTFDAYHGRLAGERLRNWWWTLLLACANAAAIVIGYGSVALAAVSGRITLGDFLLYSQALYTVRDQLQSLVWQISGLYEGNLFIRNLFEFLDLPETMPPLPPGSAAPVPRPLTHGIELRGVGFRYEGRDTPVLDDVSFTIPAGQTVALVGENGAGKTTLVKLLTRLRDPTAGAVLVDGIDLRALDVDEWRRHVAVVFQDFARFNLPAHENIALGDLRRLDDRAAVETAATKGGAVTLVERMPEGYDTMLGRRFASTGSDGVDLSGGEWQRVALARAFMREDAQLLVLDEPTAALDARAEHEIYLRFKELTQGRSTLLISHRFSTVKMADHIVVLEGGRIVEQGSHAALVARGGMYARLYAMQAERYT